VEYFDATLVIYTSTVRLMHVTRITQFEACLHMFAHKLSIKVQAKFLFHSPSCGKLQERYFKNCYMPYWYYPISLSASKIVDFKSALHNSGQLFSLKQPLWCYSEVWLWSELSNLGLEVL